MSQVGRERVLRTRNKSIHAYIEGYYGIIHAGDNELFSNGVAVTYDPYIHDSFVYKASGNLHIYDSGVIYISEDGVFASGFN